VWPGTYQLDWMRCFFMSASRRGAATRGRTHRAKQASASVSRVLRTLRLRAKSNVIQTMCFDISGRLNDERADYSSGLFRNSSGRCQIELKRA
jgi:hypothetical protein